MKFRPARVNIGIVAAVLIVIGIGGQTTNAANTCVVTKVKYLKDACLVGKAYRSKAANISKAPHATVKPAAHTTACLKANFKYHTCAFGSMHARYSHPADDDGPWWIGASGW